MSMWQRTEEMARRHEQSNNVWLKLQHDGDKAVVVILGEPYPREVCFVDGRFVPFTEAMKSQGQKPTLRIAFNVALYHSREHKVFEQGVTFFKDLVHVRSKYDLDKWAFEIKRNGASKDLKTTYSILPERQLTPEEQRFFASLPIYDLEKFYNDVEAAAPSIAGHDARGAEALDGKASQAIVAQLRTLPREAVDRFCRAFNVQRVRDLPPSQLERAAAFVQALVNEMEARGAADHEIDPFA